MTLLLLRVLIYVLAINHMTYIITDSYLTQPIRDWVSARSGYAGYGLSCPICVGTWLSLGLGLTQTQPSFDWFIIYSALAGVAALAWRSYWWIMDRLEETPDGSNPGKG